MKLATACGYIRGEESHDALSSASLIEVRLGNTPCSRTKWLTNDDDDDGNRR